MVTNMIVTNMIVTNMFVAVNVRLAPVHLVGSTGMRPAPQSRRERPSKPALSRIGIIDAAMTVLAGDGFEKLTMRRLAADLDTGPASLYVYVASTTELHALVIDRLLADLDLDRHHGADWRWCLRELLADYVMLLMSHPGLARSALVVWPQGPHYLDLVERVLRLLADGGVPAGRAAWGVDVLLQFATGMATEYSTRGESDSQDDADLLATLGGATPARHPILSGLSPAQVMGGERGERRDWALDVVIAGVAVTARGDERSAEHHGSGT